MKMIKTDDKNKCSGCGTCALVCPQKCIGFIEDELGARYPQINSSLCIDCGACSIVCPIQKVYSEHRIGEKLYAAYSRIDDVRFRGSSGGMFETFANYIISEGGSVFASKFDENLQLKCFEAVNSIQVREMCKSKYLQSDCSSMFPVIKQRIIEGKKVLFCSTPCQVSALNNYIGGLNRDNLYLVDFFCHGVPSQSFFDKCINYLEKTGDIKITDFQFRSKKKNGATPHYYKIKYMKNGVEKEKISLYTKNPFYLGFQKYITLRDSCYHCPFGKGNHIGDITIGDFHDIDNYIEGINRFDGVSTIIINSDKGFDIWNAVSDTLVSYELDINSIYNDKVFYFGGTDEPKQRKEFIDDLKTMEFKLLIDKWFASKKEWKKEVYYLLPLQLRKFIKRISKI